jgi:hypothetical protein
VDGVWELVGGGLLGLEDERLEWGQVMGKRRQLTNLLRVEGSWSPFCMIAKVESLYGLAWAVEEKW